MSDEQPEIEAAAKAIYESRLLMQPREPWGSHAPSRSVTEKFCIEAARAAVAAYEAAKGEAESPIAGGVYRPTSSGPAPSTPPPRTKPK